MNYKNSQKVHYIYVLRYQQCNFIAYFIFHVNIIVSHKIRKKSKNINIRKKKSTEANFSSGLNNKVVIKRCREGWKIPIDAKK